MEEPEELRLVADTRALAAMTHSLRRRLLDLLDLEGPATATMLAERTGHAVGVISHHLHLLGASGLAEETPQLSRDGGERLWQLVSATIRVLTSELPDDPVSKVVVAAAHSLTLERHIDFVRAWMDVRENYPREWRDGGGFSTDSWLRLTPAEVAELRGEVIGLFQRWSERAATDNGQERQFVFVFAHAVRAVP